MRRDGRRRLIVGCAEVSCACEASQMKLKIINTKVRVVARDQGGLQMAETFLVARVNCREM
jgi:hypothetical protein